MVAGASALTLALACASGQPPAAKSGATAPESASSAPRQAEPELAVAVEPLTETAPVEEPGGHELAPGEDADSDLGGDVPAPGTVDAESLLHESMEAYQSAEAFWQQGAFDDAFAALDHAYERMAEVPTNGDPVVGQEKENLRNLISRRIVEIYASRQTAVGDIDRSIPLVVNDDVQREIESFQGRERDFFLDAYRRSGTYRPMILDRLQQAGLPEQLSWLPLVESGYKDRALSTARALGLWQFIASTGYRYGLDRNTWIDERMDPEKSTDAAIAYLTALHNLFGDWLTALAAYNCGERNVLRQINNQKVAYFDQFWDLYARLPGETRRYVPRFLATLAIVEDPAKYGFELPEVEPPLLYEVVRIERPGQLSAMEKVLGLEAGVLARLNPELRRSASPAQPYELKVPPGSGATLLASLDSVPEWKPPAYDVHRVRRGETLSAIASRYRTSIGELMRLNHLRSANRIWPGQQLQVPGAGGGAAAAVARADVEPGTLVRHRVRTGDSLWLLASRYATTVDRIRADNGLSGNVLQPGQVLSIRAGGGAASAAGGDAVYTVQPGDTLGSIAEARGVPLSALLAANRLSEKSTIYPGQRLTIPD